MADVVKRTTTEITLALTTCVTTLITSLPSFTPHRPTTFTRGTTMNRLTDHRDGECEASLAHGDELGARLMLSSSWQSAAAAHFSDDFSAKGVRAESRHPLLNDTSGGRQGAGPVVLATGEGTTLAEHRADVASVLLGRRPASTTSPL